MDPIFESNATVEELVVLPGAGYDDHFFYIKSFLRNNGYCHK